MRQRVLRTLLSTLRSVRSQASRTLGLLAVLVVVVGTILFARTVPADGRPMGWDEALYSTLGLFFFAGNRLGYPFALAHRLIYFLAPFVSASALFEALARMLEERGTLFAGRLRGHTVVGGLGNLGATIARHVDDAGGLAVVLEANPEARELAEFRGRGAGIVLVGDMTSPELLRRARCRRANDIFLTARSDVVNLEAGFLIRRLARGARHLPRIYCHVYDGALVEALAAQLHGGDGDATIVPFNSYRFAARALVAELFRDRLVHRLRITPGLVLARTEWPPSGSRLPALSPTSSGQLDEDRRRLFAAVRCEPDDPAVSAERFAIIGLGRFGRAVLEELLLRAVASARFLVVDRSEACLAAVLAHLSADERARVESCVGDATEPVTSARVDAFAPSSVMLCTDNDLHNLRLAADLRRRDLRAITRMFDHEAGRELGRGLDQHGIAIVGLARLFRSAIPLLTHDAKIIACLDLDFDRTRAHDHLFYLARLEASERHRLGQQCIGLDELPGAAEAPRAGQELSLVWHRAVHRLDAR